MSEHEPHAHEHTPDTRRERHRDTPVNEVWQLIQAGIERALDYQRDLDDTTARLIALILAPSVVSNLTLYAETGGHGPHTTNAALRAEYLPIYHDPDTPDEIRELIDWLGVHLIRRDNPTPNPYKPAPGRPLLTTQLWHTPLTSEDAGDGMGVWVRGDAPPETLGTLPGVLAPLIARHGNAFTAFLSLPDVDATSPHLEDAFTDAHRGSFPSRRAAIAALTDIDDIDAGIADLADRYIGGDFVTIDRDGLWTHLTDTFDIVEDNDQWHVFDP